MASSGQFEHVHAASRQHAANKASTSIDDQSGTAAVVAQKDGTGIPTRRIQTALDEAGVGNCAARVQVNANSAGPIRGLVRPKGTVAALDGPARRIGYVAVGAAAEQDAETARAASPSLPEICIERTGASRTALDEAGIGHCPPGGRNSVTTELTREAGRAPGGAGDGPANRVADVGGAETEDAIAATKIDRTIREAAHATGDVTSVGEVAAIVQEDGLPTRSTVARGPAAGATLDGPGGRVDDVERGTIGNDGVPTFPPEVASL